jgi:hypothetical protein
MSYTITLTDGSVFGTIQDGTINTNSSMTLVGKNYAGYGQFLDNNFIRLLENASNIGSPPAPLTGQLWWNNTPNAGSLSVYMGTAWKTLAAMAVSATTPSSSTYSTVGDMWFNTTTQQVNIWTGSAWLLVGPQFSAGTGVTGAFANVITDGANVSITHKVIELVVDSTVVGIISEDTAFVPQGGISGFSTINPGLQLANIVSGIGGTSVPAYWGTGNTGISVTGNISGNVFIGNGTQLTGLYSNANVANYLPTFSGTLQVGNIVNANGNGIGNIGNGSAYFNTIFAKATSAQYADVAERFAADAVYKAGTVVELGGNAEITLSATELSETVLGVISTRAAYLMNSGAGDDATHPPVAMTGRVPVQCIGIVHKGDRLVGAGNGVARSAQPGEATAFNIIGRALEDKTDSVVGMVEAIVTIK